MPGGGIELIENKNCSICNASIKLIHHHLSYEPEIIVIVCWDCHMIIHRMAELIRMPQIQQEIICNWVKQYGICGKEETNNIEKANIIKNIGKIMIKITKKNIGKLINISNRRKNMI